MELKLNVSPLQLRKACVSDLCPGRIEPLNVRAGKGCSVVSKLVETGLIKRAEVPRIKASPRVKVALQADDVDCSVDVASRNKFSVRPLCKQKSSLRSRGENDN